MRAPLSWIKEFVDIPASVTAEQISDGLIRVGFEVEEIIKQGADLTGPLKFAKVLSIEEITEFKKPIRYVELDCNEGQTRFVICGARNFEVNDLIVAALPGAVLPGNFAISARETYGKTSNGMICSAKELGISDDHAGIIVLPEGKIGSDAISLLDIKDVVFDIAVNPDRGYAMSVRGLARELAGSLRCKYVDPADIKITKKLDAIKSSKAVSVKIEDKSGADAIYIRTFEKVNVKRPTPLWMQRRIEKCGMRSISLAVDITNYVMLELGQPLHAFDADEIVGNSVFVKTLPSNSPFVTLDEVDRKLDQNDLMICNQEGGMCIAGVFGGLKSGVKQSTKNIFLESAYFNPVFVRKTAKRHGLNTDASFRFERGIDPNITMIALQKAAMLIKEVAGGEIASTPTDTHPENFENFEVSININRVNALIGKNIEKPIIKDILNSLDIEIIDQIEQNWLLSIPPYRVDVKREADVVEEILRIYGYNEVKIPQKINASVSFTQGLDFQKFKSSIADNLIGLGFNEAMSNSLISSENIAKAKIVDENLLVKPENPLSAELDALRPNLLVNALEAVRYNLNRKQENIKLFEIGKGYILNEEKYSETRFVSITVSGNAMSGNWKDNPQPADFYFANADSLIDDFVQAFLSLPKERNKE